MRVKWSEYNENLGKQRGHFKASYFLQKLLKPVISTNEKDDPLTVFSLNRHPKTIFSSPYIVVSLFHGFPFAAPHISCIAQA
jgi:hypothetical protein